MPVVSKYCDKCGIKIPAEDFEDGLAIEVRRAAVRLGPPDEQSDLGDPAFMVVHALNLVDPNNWPEVLVTLPDGTETTARRYHSPPAEHRHFATLQEAAQPRLADANMQASLGLALEDPSRSSPELAAAAVEWAQSAGATPKNEGEGADEDRMREQAVVTAAMIMMRDGDTELRARHEAWARSVFARTLQTKEDPVYRFRSGLRFNPIAIAFVGMIHSLKDRVVATGDVRALLEVAARDDPAGAHGLSVAATILTTIDERLPRAVLRCAFAACIWPNRGWDLPEEEFAARSERHRERVQAAVGAEVGEGSARARKRRRSSIRGSK